MVGANRARGRGALVVEAGERESSANDRRGEKHRPGKEAPVRVSSVTTASASSEAAAAAETSRALPEQKSSSMQFVRAVPSELETPVGASRRASRGAVPRDPPGVSVEGGVSRRRSSGVRQKGGAGKGNKELAASADVVGESQDGKRGGGALSLRVLIRDELRSALANAAIVQGSLSESVPLRCASSGKEIATRVRDFLHSGRKVLLLTGAAGSGKSSFVTSLARDLTADTTKRTGFLPVLLEAREAEGAWGMPLDSMVEHYLMNCLG